jgi:hypothetical protein
LAAVGATVPAVGLAPFLLLYWLLSPLLFQRLLLLLLLPFLLPLRLLLPAKRRCGQQSAKRHNIALVSRQQSASRRRQNP